MTVPEALAEACTAAWETAAAGGLAALRGHDNPYHAVLVAGSLLRDATAISVDALAGRRSEVGKKARTQEGHYEALEELGAPADLVQLVRDLDGFRAKVINHESDITTAGADDYLDSVAAVVEKLYAWAGVTPHNPELS